MSICWKSGFRKQIKQLFAGCGQLCFGIAGSVCVVLSICVLQAPVYSQSRTTSVQQASTSAGALCTECPLPQGPKTDINSSADLTFAKGEALNHVTSIKRVVIDHLGLPTQALAVRYMQGTACKDTTVFFSDVRRVVLQGLGIGGATISTPIYPAREFFRQEPLQNGLANFLEITPLLAYGGRAENSLRNTGFDDIYYGVELCVAPFGRMLGRSFQLGIGAGVIRENSRLRVPVFAQLRYTFAGALHEQRTSELVPGPCVFRKRNPNSIDDTFEPADSAFADSLIRAGYAELRSADTRDSTVFICSRVEETQGDLRPFLFVEGGPVFNGGFDGAGRDPSANPDEYGQYVIGAGAGLPIFDRFVVQLQYRYMRLNVRTPCLTCPPSPSDPNNFFIVNTNKVHSVLLKLGYRFEW